MKKIWTIVLLLILFLTGITVLVRSKPEVIENAAEMDPAIVAPSTNVALGIEGALIWRHETVITTPPELQPERPPSEDRYVLGQDAG